MSKADSFAQFLTTQSPHISLGSFLVNLLLAAILALNLEYFYIHRSTSLSNRRVFAKNFVLITMTTMLIITIVKSSLALSLGLVGALSIVRFRAAIKEPEELTYLFLAITVGLGLGADQRVVTIFGFVLILFLLFLRSLSRKEDKQSNLFVTVASNQPKNTPLDEIVEILSKYGQRVKLQRVDSAEDRLEALFLVVFDDFETFNTTRLELESLDNSVKLSFVEELVTY